LVPHSVLVAGLLFVSSSPAAACTCAGLPPEEYADKANVVLVGTLTAVRFEPPLTVTHSESRKTLIDLRVERYLKGAGPATLTFLDPGYAVIEVRDGQPWSGGVGCSAFGDRAVSRRFLLLLETTDPESVVNFCGGSTALDGPGTEFAANHLASIEHALQVDSLPSGGGVQASARADVWAAYATVLGSLAFLVGGGVLLAAGRTGQRMRNGLTDGQRGVGAPLVLRVPQDERDGRR
jgi:hypothetical protein